ncbi:putative gag-pol polyprotein [Cucumis melo var. makuwa]|uniref:Putative gag-pol polyprotein n=1 Tax=Cucumis melo var. makuwa TaxID=1194695 RepID=A0A5D3DVA1_CUCMM|nr:putative gag-pol polyprotein [Cucumis melo var. makuwa]
MHPAPQKIEQIDKLKTLKILLTRDRARRTPRPPSRYASADFIPNHSLEYDNEEPSNFEEAFNSDEKDEWLASMKNEINSLHKNKNGS